MFKKEIIRNLPVLLLFFLPACGDAPPSLIAATDVLPSLAAITADSPTLAVLPTQTIAATSPSTPTATLSPTITQTDTASRTKNTHKYVLPVQPQSAADFASGGHAYPATDIYAPAGTDFVAVTAGTVDFVSRDDLWNPESDDPAVAGGLCVAIIGDDGIRYYGSHLSEVADGIKRGVRVKAGQRLGMVGKSGNAAKTAPHLHFGISHPTFPEDWLTRRGELDPYPYLIAWSRGEDVTPRFPTPTPSPHS